MSSRNLLPLSFCGLLLGCPAPAPSAEKDQPTAAASAKSPASSAEPSARVSAPSPASTRPPTTLEARRWLFGEPEERLWGGLVLGRGCDERSSHATALQLLQAMSLWLAEARPPERALLHAAAWAVGACAERDGEDLLRPWLTAEAQASMPDMAEAAALGLSTWVDRRGQLSERTQTALLEAAERANNPQLLSPLGRASRLSEAVGAHLLEVAAKFLTAAPNEGRRQVILALGSAGESAAEPLAQVLLKEHYSIQERTAAVQSLARLGDEGQRQLDASIAALLNRGLPSSETDSRWVPLLSALALLKAPQRARPELTKLGSVLLPESDKARAQRRRLVSLKCRAAELLATSHPNPVLDRCDPERGRSYQLAVLSLLSRSKLSGARLSAFETARKSPDPVVQQAALRLLTTHSEIPDRRKILVEALSGADPGSITLAAQIVHSYPDLATDTQGPTPNRELHHALGRLLENAQLPQETRAAAILAVGATGALNLKSLVDRLCKGQDRLLWSPAAEALQLLGDARATCPNEAQSVSSPAQPAQAALPSEHPITVLVVESDVGPLELHLDSSLAPNAVAHVLSQVDAGSYNHQRISFGRPGFTVQFGDEDEDGYDSAPAAGLPFEVSPRPFSAWSVGMSSFAPGAENTQLFVTLSDAPQLFGSRILLGQAKGPWELLVWGDELQSVRRLTK